MPFKKGNIPNPTGKNGYQQNGFDLRRLLNPLVPRAIEVLKEALEDPDVKLKAAEQILDRVFGKPRQDIEMSGNVTIKVAVNCKESDGN